MQLAAEVTHLRSVINWVGADPGPDYKAVAPNVNGIVEDVVGNDLIDISIGADAGLLKGHQLHVYRIGTTNAYLGKVEVVRTNPTTATCKIVKHGASFRRAIGLPRDSSSESAETPVYRKPRPDVYTMLLVIALLAVLVAIFALYAEMKDYEFQYKGGPAVSQAISSSVPAPAVLA